MDARKGHIHWIKSGEVEVYSGEESLGILCGPGVIFSPKGSAHTLIPRPQAELVSAEFEFGQCFNNPLTSINPSVILISVAEASEIEVIHTLLMLEAFSNQCGKSFRVNQLNFLKFQPCSIGYIAVCIDRAVCSAKS